MLLLTGFFTVNAQTGRGTITGQVVNAVTKEPIPFANVVVLDTDFGAATGEEGKFTIDNLKPGSYRLRASAVGYIPISKTDIVVTNNKPASVMFELVETSVELDQITVQADYFYREPTDINSVRTFGYEEIRRSPGGFEDVIRALSILPGVAQADGGRNDLIVRGGAPSENLYLVDGIDVPNINHFGTQGATGGPLSYINLDFVQETSFSTGAFPVLYGDKLSSVLRIDLREGREDRIGGKATVSATQFGLNLEGPLWEDANFLFSARRSYLDFIFKAADFGFVPEYYDYITKLNYDLDPKNELSFLLIGAIDNVRYFNETADQRYDNSRVLGSDQMQYVTGLSWRHLFDNGFYKISLGRVFVDYDTQQRDSLLNPIFTNISKEKENKVRAEVVYRFTKAAELTFGGDFKLINTEYDVKLPSFRTTFGEILPIDSLKDSRDFIKYSLFANWTHIYLDGAFSLNLGGRLDYFDGINNPYYLMPRFAASYHLTPLTSINFSTGIYRQSPSYIWLIADEQNKDLDMIRVDQYVAGIDHRLQADMQVKLEAYYKDYSDYPASTVRPYLVLANTGAGFSGAGNNFASFGLEPLLPQGNGFSRGIEFSIQKKLSDIPYYGVLSFTLNESRYTALDGVERIGSYDQTILFTLSGGYRFNDNLEASVRFRYATGKPYTPYNSDGTQNVADYNSERLPDLHSLDIRVDRKWFFESTTLIVYLDIQNIYNRENVSNARWDEREQKIDLSSSIGILPSIGVSLEF